MLIMNFQTLIKYSHILMKNL